MRIVAPGSFTTASAAAAAASSRAPLVQAAVIRTGTIRFLDGSNPLATVAFDAAASATYSTNALTAGAHTISANYSDDADDAAATTSIGQQVNAPGAPAVAVAASALSNWMLGLLAIVVSAASGAASKRRFD